MLENNKSYGQDTGTEEEYMAKKKKYPELERVLKNLEDWNKRTRKYLDEMYKKKKKRNPGDPIEEILEGILQQNIVLKEITVRVGDLPKIRDNTTYMMATLVILTAVMIGLGTWIVTHI